jgi:hypothetical protein
MGIVVNPAIVDYLTQAGKKTGRKVADRKEGR